MHWLYQARKRYELSVLNTMVTSNHVHLLVLDDGGIKGEVCRLYGVDLSRLSQSKRGQYNEPTNIAIHLTQRLRGNTPEGIGEAYGIGKYSSVSSVIQRVKQAIQNDEMAEGRVEE